MKTKIIRHSGFSLALVCLLLALAQTQVLAQNLQTSSGELADGTAYRIDYPQNFNGTLLIGLDYAGGQYRNEESQALLAAGYAMTGVTRLVTGWDVEASIANQLRVLDLYELNFGQAQRTLVYGRSLGAHTGAAIIQSHGERFDGALLACGGLAGAVGMWNAKLDAMFVSKTLLAANDPNLPVINIPDNFAETARPAWLAMLQQAQQTAEGRARIALAAVIGQLPAWAHPDKAQAAPYDLAGLQEGLYDSLAGSPLPLAGQAMSSRNELNRRSGGSISFNTNVDYREMLDSLKDADIVYELYRQAGLDLDADLNRLQQAPRVSADSQALAWIASQVWHGDLSVPVLTMSNIGDNISAVAAQQSFAETISRAGKADMLRQLYVDSAGHCAFSAAETLAAVDTLVQRVDSGSWGQGTNPYTLNTQAEALDLGPARFIPYQPEPMLRSFDACDLQALGVDVELPAARQCGTGE